MTHIARLFGRFGHKVKNFFTKTADSAKHVFQKVPNAMHNAGHTVLDGLIRAKPVIGQVVSALAPVAGAVGKAGGTMLGGPIGGALGGTGAALGLRLAGNAITHA